ncbi:hypothetical protein G7Y89_g12938 [Cudoniella acicularis]|uniref:Uncharacterized protein n=1 Tax=Cudoniella acicularis TaxID=354080 RepID=A0A8H4VZ63_9HELO|nr:hypothetical protein G7Y89_g12938 [Cudoniella acicularis]
MMIYDDDGVIQPYLVLAGTVYCTKNPFYRLSHLLFELLIFASPRSSSKPLPVHRSSHYLTTQHGLPLQVRTYKFLAKQENNIPTSSWVHLKHKAQKENTRTSHNLYEDQWLQTQRDRPERCLNLVLLISSPPDTETVIQEVVLSPSTFYLRAAYSKMAVSSRLRIFPLPSSHNLAAAAFSQPHLVAITIHAFTGLPIQQPGVSQMPDAWQIAVETHLASLTASQKAAFVAPANTDDCMKLITKSYRARGFSRILNVMRPIIDPLRRFEAMIDVLVQTNGGLCSPIWGPLRFAITA